MGWRPERGRGSRNSYPRRAEPLNGRVDPGPLLGKEPLGFALQEQTARAGVDEHTETSSLLDQLLFDQLLISLENRERIDPVFGRDGAHGWQRIAFLEHAVEDHRDHAVVKLAVDRLAVVPLTIHHALQRPRRSISAVTGGSPPR